jgi:hypothetical protein
MSFEISMCTEGFADMARSAVFGMELDGFEVGNVVCEREEREWGQL